jgi:hypothetical protein
VKQTDFLPATRGRANLIIMKAMDRVTAESPSIWDANYFNTSVDKKKDF